MDFDQQITSCQKFINQLPGMVFIVSLNHKIIAANYAFAKSMGYQQPEVRYGVDYENMRCEAAEGAKVFIGQDVHAIQTHNKRGYLSHRKYTDGWKLLLGEKKMLFNEHGAPLGVIASFQDITKSNLVDIRRFIAPKIYAKDTESFEFTITYDASHTFLDNDQLEILYFLLRDKSDECIAMLLNASVDSIKKNVEGIMQKMRCDSRKQLIDASVQAGLFDTIPSSIFQRASGQ